MAEAEPLDVLVVALPETAGSALYGMIDVLGAAGNLWEVLVGRGEARRLFHARIVSPLRGRFLCGNRIPVEPDLCTADNPAAPVVVLPEIWLGPEEDFAGRYPELTAWLRERYRRGASLYSACSGAVVLAETGLLDGREATSHWGYTDYFRQRYPKVRFDPAPTLCFADPAGRIVTAGGTSSWHDLALHLIARHGGPGEALRIAKVYLLKWHGEGQLPFRSLVRYPQHADSRVRAVQEWLETHFKEADPVARAVAQAGLPARTLKRRFKAATGASLMDHVQNLRIEAAKRLLETTGSPFEAIAFEVGYENPGFCRRLFKRRTGLTPERYRRLFQPIGEAQQRATVDLVN